MTPTYPASKAVLPRPGLREWYITRLQQLAQVTDAEAVCLVEDLGLDWEALLKAAKEIGKSR